MKYCRASVHNAFGVSFHQCSRKPVMTDPVSGLKFCKQHSPEAEKAREKVILARRNAKAAKENAYWVNEHKKVEALKACELIVKGHNDPRSLAQMVLDGKPLP